MNGKKLVFLLTIVALFLSGAVFAQAKRAPSNDMGLVDDIPEPPDASAELPSPIPMVVEYVGGLMAGDFDKCLQHFHVPTFLGLIFGDDVKVMQDADYRELYSYQIQAQRNEFRFMSKVMNRVAKGCKYAYSNPRYHQNVQSKVVVKMQTTKGPHEFVVFSRYVDERWQVYDYSLDGKRFTDSFRAGLNGMKPMDYTAMLRPFYGDQKKFKQVQNDDFGFSMKLPENFQIREKVSPTLLFTAQSFDNQFLMHVQAAVYPQAKGLKEVAAEIKQGLMQFNPRLYDQWRTDIAGVEIGNVVFRFDKNGKTLFTQMVIVPLGQKLVVLNFYHNSLPLMKNLSNIRDRILESLKLTKIELAAASDVTIPADDTSLPSNSPN
ncbi:MAG TPA: hypothetical protein PKO06_22915, partial [Candidatus Ozemobacteraceae bacterium]|nr:hypothetical protein [Candidatus Ozemobacteraceae bacterium]